MMVKGKVSFRDSLVFLAILLFSCLFLSQKAGASIPGAGYYFPDTSLSGSESFSLVQVVGANFPNREAYIKARTSVANVYVPESMTGQTITLSVVNGCNGTVRDNSTGGSTNFYVVNFTTGAASASVNTSNSTCSTAVKNIPLSFVATAINSGSVINRAGKVFAGGIVYNVYQFVADGVMAEASSSARYLNAFGLRSTDLRVQVGISNIPRACNDVAYPVSCPKRRYYGSDYFPGSTNSWSYSSFYGSTPSSPGSTYSQRIKINSPCRTKGGISFYDLDAQDTSLTQANMEIKLLKNGSPVPSTSPNGTLQYSLPYAAIQNWRFGIPNLLNAHPPDFSGNNNDYLDLPGGDPMFEPVAIFEKNTNYEFQILNVDSDNAIQVLPTFVACVPPLAAFDVADCTALQGWAFDPNASSTSTKISVYAGGPEGSGTLVGEYRAGVVRTDVNNAYGISGTHGYYISVPEAYKNNQIHTFYLYAKGLDLFGQEDGINSFIGQRNVGPCPSANTPPSGSIDVTCSISGIVSINYARVTDSQGGSISVTATRPDGVVSTGSSVIPAGVATNINYTVSNTFNGVRDGSPRTISGTVSDGSPGSPVAIFGTYTCPVPVFNLSCTIEDVVASSYEINSTISPRLKIVRNDSDASPSVTVTPSIKYNGATQSTPSAVVGKIDPVFLGLPTKVFTLADFNSGKFTIESSISWPGGSFTCPTSITTITNKPFFKVNNGDLLVGGVYSSTNSCTAPLGVASFGNLYSWTDRPASKGASASHVANVFKTVKDFYSASSISSTYNKLLTIANNNTSEQWGGSFDAVTCLKDVYANTIKENDPEATNNAQTISVSYTLNPDAIPGSKQVKSDGNLTITGATNFSRQLAVYVDGDVYINSNITLNTTYTGGLANLPFFALIVKGNIYISSGVTQLDGMYVAQPKNGADGNIFTCSNGFGQVLLASLNGTCNQLLTINGIVQAKEVKLHRTGGTLSSNTPAEVFNNLPELYLAPKPFKSDPSSTVKYDSAVTLPPLL